MTFKPEQTVYLPDGREAVYVTKNGDRHLVRVMREVEGAYDEPSYEYPDDKITAVQKVYASAPVEVWDKQVLAKREQVRELDRELTAKRAELISLNNAKTRIEKAAQDYPDIRQALDFIEGRITHVVSVGYSGAEIQTFADAFEDRDTHYGRTTVNGLKLLCLFGTDKQGKRLWGVNQYRDGSGSGWYTVQPARSLEEARGLVTELVDEALTAWRSGAADWHRSVVNLHKTFESNPWLSVPEDWAAHLAEQRAARKAEKIAKLREQLAALEGDQQ